MDFSLDGIGNAVSGAFDTVSNAVQHPIDSLGKFHNFMSNTSQGPAPSQFFSGEPTKNLFKNTPDDQLNIGQKAVNEGARQFSNVGYYMKPSFSAFNKAAGNLVSDAVSSLPRAVVGDYQGLKNIGTDVANLGTGLANGVIDEAKSMYGSTFNNGIAGLGAPVIGFARTFGSNPGSLMLNGAQGLGSGIVDIFSPATQRQINPISGLSAPTPGLSNNANSVAYDNAQKQ